MNETWLAHHGILGQKWGVRRYENPDGTLTEAGKKRYEKLKKKRGSDDYAEAMALSKKRTKDLTNEELRKIAERKQLEKAIKGGDEETKRILIQSGTKLLGTAAVITAAAIGGKYVVNHLPEIAGTVAKSVAKAGVNVTKNVGKEVVTGAADIAKSAVSGAAKAGGEAAKAAAKAGHEVRKNVAKSAGARAYVNAVDALLGKKKRRKP